MRVYIKFISSVYFRSLIFVFLIFTSLVFILNLLSELEFFKNENVSISFTLFLSLLNSPIQVFELFPFILLITVQLFFIKFFENKEIDIFKYSGLKNSTILYILSALSILTGVLIITAFYHLSSNLKNIYLEIKSGYTTDGKYLAVITKNGLWIKDKVDNKVIITNASTIEQNFLNNIFITEFDENFNVIRNIKSNKIDISSNQWEILDAKIYEENDYSNRKLLYLNTNFDFNRIQSLYSNLSALSFVDLYQLRENYKKLNYSTIEVDMHLYKLLSYPFFLLLIALFSSVIMLNIKQIKGTTFKISIGLFFSVIIYYLNNFSYVLGSTERVSIIFSILLPLLVLFSINCLMLYNINEK